jgi:DNA-binding NtrC family response regulator
MVALLVVFTFIAAILIDALVRRGKRIEEGVELPSFAGAGVAPAAAAVTPNVLVVDDEKTVCNSCKKILTREGYNVEVAQSGEEALSKVKGNDFDVLVTDWKMPQLDGMEVAKRIKKENPNIAVVMITGYPSVETSIQALRSGVSDYVPKPFTPTELSDAMIRALAKGQAVPANLVLDRMAEKGMIDRTTKRGSADAAPEASG